MNSLLIFLKKERELTILFIFHFFFFRIFSEYSSDLEKNFLKKDENKPKNSQNSFNKKKHELNLPKIENSSKFHKKIRLFFKKTQNVPQIPSPFALLPPLPLPPVSYWALREHPPPNLPARKRLFPLPFPSFQGFLFQLLQRRDNLWHSHRWPLSFDSLCVYLPHKPHGSRCLPAELPETAPDDPLCFLLWSQ